MGLLRFIFIFILAYLIIRLISRLILRSFRRRQQNGTSQKPGRKDGETYVSHIPKDKNDKKPGKGEYVDYEEVD